ncbi:hypothetical protein [Naasia sp. SYSU D00948]|uniref:hypothetical protein n=1 Tax=Naasia sp. SYSU D00948 TaxID=2817379 RepID=UPI001B314BF0|nr:hypothetical protein [Naasia sp. SYSU D00948]
MISLPRGLVLALGALFSAYHLVLAVYDLGESASVGPVIAAMVLYAAATTISLWPTSPVSMPYWLASFNVGVTAAMCFLVTSQLDPEVENSYGTWHVAAIGTLMTITAVRRRFVFAWAGIAVLTLQTLVWAGPDALARTGVIGDIVWVAMSHMIANALAKATRDARQFALAEQEAADWRAAQEAHLSERQIRLGRMSRVSLPMLQRIALSGGDLTEEERRECFALEGALRDEIRGRRLLNDAVREQIMIARRNGTSVQLLDEGGLDDLGDAELDRVLNRLAEVLRGVRTDRLIIRAVPAGSSTAVTVVGLTTVDDGSASALSHDHDDEVDLWAEIPREGALEASPAGRG